MIKCLEARKFRDQNKSSQENSVEFLPEEFEKKEQTYTGVDIPKCRFFDPKMEVPIIENDPDHLSLAGAPDPFPLSPEDVKEREDREQAIEDLKRKVKAMRLKAEDLPNMSWSRIDVDINDSVRNIQDEYENFEDSTLLPKDTQE